MTSSFRVRRGMLVATWLAAVACSSDANVIAEPKYNAGVLTALIGGLPHQSTTVTTLVEKGAIDIRGTAANGRELRLHLTATDGVGTVSLGGSSNSFGGYIQSQDAIWQTKAAGNTGTVTLTMRSAARLVGTFRFTMVPLHAVSAGEVLEVFNGEFDVTI